MKKIALALLLLGAAPAAGTASTFIVASDAQMLAVMDSVRAGDVVQINDGTYANAPKPTHSGTASSRITIIGNTANPAAVIVGQLDGWGASYITWRAMRFNGSCKLGPRHEFSYTSPTADSVVSCRSLSGENGMSGAQSCVFSADTIGSNADNCNFVLK